MIYEAREGVITIKITCPNCTWSARHSVSYIEDAIHDDLDIACVACGKPFGVVTVSRARVAEQRDAPVHAAIELLHQVRDFSGGAAVTLTGDFIAKIDAVLNMAAGG